MIYNMASPLVRAAFFFGLILMLSACCEKQPLFQDGNEAVMYWICSNCHRPCDIFICEPLSIMEEEDIQDG